MKLKDYYFILSDKCLCYNIYLVLIACFNNFATVWFPSLIVIVSDLTGIPLKKDPYNFEGISKKVLQIFFFQSFCTTL